MVSTSFRAADTGDTGQAVEAACQPARKPLAGWRLPEGKRATLTRRPLPFPFVTDVASGVFSGSTGYRPVVKEPSYTCAPSAPGCLAASDRQARLRLAAAGAPASLRRTRWRGFGLSLRSDA
ncbi:hypothetical protein CSS49_24395 [Salmonella enterica]|nr:hypothetical protein [Salmonella enterica]